MINDLAEFITILLNKKHEIIVGIDANEANDQQKNGVDKLLQLTKLIDVISQQHGIYAKNLIPILEDANTLNSFYVLNTSTPSLAKVE